ncbi:MAG TPA: aminotransferase class I/II-fold pyridoxal phosphate-dependent enzyme [Chitinophagaceae bacterium]
MITFSHTPGRTVNAGGKELLFFSGYAYLGMHGVPEFIELVKEGIDRFGMLFPSSRISNTRFDLFDTFESKLSEISGTEATVSFSSGFLAGRAVMELFKGQEVSSPAGTHPAISGLYFEGEFGEWRRSLRENAVASFDAVNPLTATVNDTSWLNEISGLTCIIDDSHGTGLLNNGRGIYPGLPDRHQYILPYSLSKAWNIGGGAVGCTAETANRLRRTAYYAGSTGISPALMHAFVNGQELYNRQREQLKENILLFRSLTADRFRGHGDLPVFILPSDIDEQRLLEQGCAISSFAYPDPGGTKINRVVINALHTQEDLERLSALLQ